eukprot:Blabericola_migrator_1__1414@NODE_136_length_13169_cov_18_658831_g118_i0_p2_GENE_NODE_136_length_13169_cov_18_658831_g118_i0NODE_136_length_13169_cov_18_658831_g118_i0_p2_ORF_typecomplete_len122_score14_12_NODE_136_length_13169_cov_18_658831_g118_i090459410
MEAPRGCLVLACVNCISVIMTFGSSEAGDSGGGKNCPQSIPTIMCLCFDMAPAAPTSGSSRSGAGPLSVDEAAPMGALEPDSKSTVGGPLGTAGSGNPSASLFSAVVALSSKWSHTAATHF